MSIFIHKENSNDRLKFFTGSLKPIVTVIAEARNTSPVPEMHNRNPNFAVEQSSLWNVTKILKDPPSDSSNRLHIEHALGQPKSSNLFVKRNLLQSENFSALTESYGTDLSDETIKDGPAYPPFPCPFCDRAYTSWGFRRRHIKAVHTISPSLNCKWCLQVSFQSFSICCRI